MHKVCISFGREAGDGEDDEVQEEQKQEEQVLEAEYK